MKLIPLLLIIILLNGCFTQMVTHQFSKNSSSEYPLNKMNKLEGGITEKNNFIISRMSNENDYIFMINDNEFRQAQISKDEDQFYLSDKVEEVIIRKIAIYTLEETPSANEEYLKIITCKPNLLIVEYRDLHQNKHQFEVINSYSRDPNYLKRTGLAIVYPVAISIDLCLGIISQGGYSLDRRDW